jgi:hypothetical protein
MLILGRWDKNTVILNTYLLNTFGHENNIGTTDSKHFYQDSQVDEETVMYNYKHITLYLIILK